MADRRTTESRKTYVLDTSVLLSDPGAWARFGEHEVVLPLVVISELEGKRAQWNRQVEDALGQAGRTRNEADAYYQTRTNEAKAIVAVAQAEAEGVRKEAQALGKLGGEAYVKMQVAQQLSHKRVTIVPGSNVSTMDVNKLVDYLVATKNKKEEAEKQE